MNSKLIHAITLFAASGSINAIAFNTGQAAIIAEDGSVQVNYGAIQVESLEKLCQFLPEFSADKITGVYQCATVNGKPKLQNGALVVTSRLYSVEEVLEASYPEQEVSEPSVSDVLKTIVGGLKAAGIDVKIINGVNHVKDAINQLKGSESESSVDVVSDNIKALDTTTLAYLNEIDHVNNQFREYLKSNGVTADDLLDLNYKPEFVAELVKKKIINY